MKHLVILIVCILLLSGAVLAQKGKNPTFSQYGVRVERIKSTSVDLSSNKRARMFRTNLRNAAKESVNFAGHYVLTNWGCGTNCSMAAIIDKRNGKVYFPTQLEGYGYGLESWSDAEEPLEFKPGSKLVILEGYSGGELNKDKPSGGIHYFVWNGTTLRRIKFIKKSDKQ